MLSTTNITAKLLEDHWLEQLKGYRALQLLHGPRSGSDLYLQVPMAAELQQRVMEIAGNSSLGANLIYLAAWMALASRYASAEDIACLCPGQAAGEVWFRLKCGPGMHFRNLLAELQGQLKGAMEHPISDAAGLQSRMELNDWADGEAIRQLGFAYDGWRADANDFRGAAINLAVLKKTGQVALAAKAGQTSEAALQQLGQHYLQFLSALLDVPETPISTVAFLSDTERSALDQGGNFRSMGIPTGTTLPELVHAQAQLTPDALALKNGGFEISYAELLRRVAVQTQFLRCEYDLQAGDRVAVLMHRCPEALISMLAIMQAGGVYVPIDPNYPQARINFMLADAQPALLLHFTADEEKSGNYAGPRMCIETAMPDEPFPDFLGTSEAAAYMIYTSGSTGQPKGVLCAHEGLINMSLDQIQQFSVVPGDRILQFASLSFDASLYETFMAWLAGACVVQVPHEMAMEPGIFADFLRREKVAIATLPPSFLATLGQQDLNSLRQLITAGEAAIPADAVRYSQQMRYFNAYGPTETSVCASYFEVNPAHPETEPVPIGKAVANNGLFLVDQHLAEVPNFVAGELLVGGKGLALEYWQRPELTAEKFVQVAFGNGRAYRTGDRAYRLPDGNFVFLGRADAQVKIRGHRVEPGEIRQVLLSHPQLRNAVVLAMGEREDIRLIAFLEGEKLPPATHFRDFLAGQLPAYMIPVAFYQLKELPRNQNGKIDQKYLLELAGKTEMHKEAYVAPRNSAEAEMARIWEEILRLEKVGVNDNFSVIGGDSLKAVHLMTAINTHFKVEMSVGDVFRFPTVAELAAAIDNSENLRSVYKLEAEKELQTYRETVEANPELAARIPQTAEALFPMSDIAFGMLFHTLQAPESVVYHNQKVHQFRLADFSEANFRQALVALVHRHEILRSLFLIAQFPEPTQVVCRELPLPLTFVDLRNLESQEQEKNILNWLETDRAKPFLPDTGKPFWRVQLFQISADEVVMAWVFHHAILDGWSDGLLLMELLETYQKIVAGKDYLLPPLQAHYQDFVLYQLAAKRDPELRKFWESEFQDFQRLELAGAAPATASGPGRQVVRFGDDLRLALEGLAQAEQTSLRTVCFAAFAYLMNMMSYRSDFTVGVVEHNRPPIVDGDRLVGCFLTTLPLRLEIESGQNWREFIRYADSRLIAIRQHAGLSLQELKEIAGPRAHGQNPFFDVMFGYVDFYHMAAGPAPEAPETRLELKDLAHTNTFLDFDISRTGEQLNLIVHHNKSHFPETYIRRLTDTFARILRAMVAEPDTVIDRKNLMDASALKCVWPGSQINLEAPFLQQTVWETFARQVAETPAALAVQAGNKALTYAELARLSGAIAAGIRGAGVQAGDRVGLWLERNEYLVASILGVLKCGAVYVPIDPATPVSRASFMLRDSAAKILLCNAEHEKHCASWAGIPVVAAENSPLDDPENPASINPEGGIYIMYTSGSTGQPKGIQTRESGVLRLVKNTNYADLKAGDRILQLSNYAFDGSTFDIFGALLNGASLYMVPTAMLSDLDALARFIAQHKINVSFVTTALFNRLVETCPELIGQFRKLYFGGEDASPVHVRRALEYRQAADAIVHVYGPTETTTYATFHVVNDLDPVAKRVPIGKAITQTDVFVLDDRLEICPPGVPGEICIAGPGLAAGYLNRPELTAEKFVEQPWDQKGKMYRSGDMAVRLPDGAIDFLGRQDTQVKIRGFRIELLEIESAMLAATEVREAALVVDAADNILAYFVAPTPIEGATLRKAISEFLPSYMLPAAFMQMDALPLNQNGKIDKAALPAPETLAGNATHQLPENPQEAAVLEVWEEVLGRKGLGLDDNFFEVGGHSLRAMQLMNRLNERLGAQFDLKRIFVHTSIRAQAALLRSMAPREAVSIPVLPPAAHYASSHAQRRLWVLSQLENQSQAYHIPALIPIQEALNVPALQQAFTTLISRHEPLRTVFAEYDGAPRQVVRAPFPARIHQHDLRASEQPLMELERALAEIDAQAYDLEKGPLFRLHLFRTGEEDYRLLLHMHHIICDGWSITVLQKEVMQLYAAACEGRGPDLPELSIQYKDFAAWQNQRLAEGSGQKDEAYWLEKFSGELPVSHFPEDFPRPGMKDFKGANYRFLLNSRQAETLSELGKSVDATGFVSFLAVLNVLLNAYSGATDSIIGTSVAGRDAEALEKLIGFFVHTLPLRTQFSPKDTFQQVLAACRDTVFEAFAHQDYPYDLLVDQLELPRDLARNPLFDILLVWHTWNPDAATDTEAAPEVNSSKFDLSFFVSVRKDGLTVDIEYATSLYEPATIARIAAGISTLVDALAESPEMPIHLLPVCVPDDQEILQKNSTGKSPAKGAWQSVVEMYQAACAKDPNGLAVYHEGNALTRAEAETVSLRTAHWLQNELNIQPGETIAVELDYGCFNSPVLLGILRAGGVFLAIDPALPEARKQALLEDSKAVAVIGKAHAGLPWILPNRLPQASERAPVPLRPDAPAYLVYTSGSTGKPKGVLGTHGCLANLIQWQAGPDSTGPGLRTLQFASLGFDVSVQEQLYALCTGGTLIVPERRKRLEFDALGDLIAQTQCELLIMPFTALNAFFQTEELFPKLKSLRHLVTSGEQLILTDELRSFLESHPEVVLHNQYGPSETHVISSHRLSAGRGNLETRPPIGRPLDHSQIYLLNEALRPCPLGAIGEMYLGGRNVALGYPGQPELTAERFVDDPFAPGQKLYRSGDLGRWRADGTLEFIGRNDAQLKVRGYRVEPAEVELALLAHPQVREAVVVPHQQENAPMGLAAYFVSENDVPAMALREFLQDRLPGYMVPEWLVPLTELPLTRTGKTDRKALPVPSPDANATAVEMPANETEAAVLKVWQEVLQRDGLSVTDNFFAVGGHSLKAIRLNAGLGKQFGQKLAVKDIFQHPTVRAQARLLQNSATDQTLELPEMDGRAHYPISHAQLRMWLLHRDPQRRAAYNMPCVLPIDGKIDFSSMQNALADLAQLHVPLRTTFEMQAGKPVQVVHAEIEIPLLLAGGMHDTPAVEDAIRVEAQHEFDLETGPPFRARILETAEGKSMLILNLHHIVADEWSLTVLVRDLARLYEGHAAGTPAPVQPAAIQYPSFALWQEAYLKQPQAEQDRAYWTQKLADFSPLPDLGDLPDSGKRGGPAGIYQLLLGEAQTRQMDQVAAQFGTTRYNICLALVKILLYHYSGQEDVSIGTSVTGRMDPKLENVVGLFLNQLLLRTHIDPEQGFGEILQSVQTTVTEALAHEAYSYDLLVEDLGLANGALFDLIFVWNEHRGETINAGKQHAEGTETGEIPNENLIAKFDLTWQFSVQEKTLLLKLVYDRHVFSPDFMRDLGADFLELTNNILNNDQ